MKTPKLISVISMTVLLSYSMFTKGQSIDSLNVEKEFIQLEEAFKVPEKVIRLNLSNQSFEKLPLGLSKFVNLQYLSLRNDHLKEIPAEISELKKLRILDLSGNDFQMLPANFSRLNNLEELYLDDEKNINLSKNFELLSKLPKLKILHLEKDKISKLPKNITILTHLETLYLSDNNLRFVPPQVKSMVNLRYLELKHNPINSKISFKQEQDSGLKIKF
jgi:Leucine-rich repeat (LRR) protein